MPIPVQIVLFLLLLVPAAASADGPLRVDSAERIPLGKHAKLFVDKDGQVSIDDILGNESIVFSKPERETFQFGYSTAAFWLSSSLTNPSSEAILRFLEINYSPLDDVQVYLIEENGQIGQQFQLGDSQSFHERPVKSRNYIAPLELSAQSSYRLLIRVQSTSSIFIPAYISESNSLVEHATWTNIAFGIFYGIVIGLVAYNIFLLITLRDLIYLKYVLYIISYTLFMASIDGILYRFWPDSTEWESRSINVFAWSSGVFLCLFCREFLKTQQFFPVADKILLGFCIVFLIGVLVFPFIDAAISARLNAPMVLANAITVFAITVYCFLNGQRTILFFVFGMGFFCFGLMAVASGSMNLFQHYEFAPTILKAGAATEMILFSVALAHRINDIRTEKELARRDADSMKAIADKMNEANEALQHAVQARTDFLANMSHEIRTPMNGVLGMVELTLDTPLNNEQKNYLDVAYRSGRTLLSLINDILDLSKIESGKLELESVDFNVRQLLTDLQELYSLQLHDKSLELEVVLNDTVPAWMTGDRTRIWQILTNLIGNAIKFTPEGKITIVVDFAEPDGFSVAVSDTGIGISPQAQAKIFDSFTQADSSTTRKFGGTGLGLTISKKLATLMHGDLNVDSELGTGTTFTLAIPVQRAETQDRSEGTVEVSGILVRSFDDLDVLVVEDNEVNKKVAMGMFKKIGIEPTIASNGKEALEICDVEAFDIIFMDVQMPIMDGLDATRRIVASSVHNRHTPIIAMTASVMEQDRQRCHDAGMKDYVAKPIYIKEIRKALEKWAPDKSASNSEPPDAPGP